MLSPHCRPARKHVYCGSRSYNIKEARVVRMAARNASVITQMERITTPRQLSTCGRADSIRAIGKGVKPMYGILSRGRMLVSRPAMPMIATSLSIRQSNPSPYQDFELGSMCGPAPETPFHNHGFEGPLGIVGGIYNGTMSDLGSHWIDLPFWL